MQIDGLDKIYIIHYDKLKDRKKYLEKRFNELGLGNYAAWVISTKEDDLNFDMSIQDNSLNAINERKKYLGDKLPKIGKIDIVMIAQHIAIMKKIAKRRNNLISMICEDDIILSDDFPKKLRVTINKLKTTDWDICYTDKGALFVDPEVSGRKESVSLYAPPNKAANTTGSYLISPACAKKLVRIMKKVSLPADLEMCYIQNKHDLNVYWTVPFLTHQGSIEYIYQSAVRKGSITGMLLVIIRKIEKISPLAAKLFANFSDKFRKAVYNSRALIWAKDKFKSIFNY